MIQFIRDKTTSIVVKIFLVLLMLSFSLWGAEGMIRRFTSDPVALTVGQQDVRLQQVTMEYQRVLQAIQRQSGSMPDPMLRRVVLEQTVAQLIQEAAAAQLVTDLRLPVARATLRREIAATPAFQNAAGQFDPVQFDLALRQIGWSEGMLIDRLATEHAMRSLWQAVLNGVPTPQPLVDAVARQATAERKLAMVTIPVTPAAVTVTEDALKAHHKDNPGAFMTPEQRTVDILRIDPGSMAKTLTVPEAELKAYYDTHTAQFTVPERRAVMQLVLPSRVLADRALALVAGGTPLQQVPATLPEARFVDLGTIVRDDLLPELAAATFGALVDKVTGPLESPLGWHLVIVTDITPGSTRSFADARAEVLATVAGNTGYEQAITQANAIEDAVFNGESLQQAAAEQGLAIETLTALTARSAADASPLLGNNPKLRQDLFRATLHEPAAFVELADGSMVTFAVTGIIPPRPQTFAEARTAVEAAYRDQQARSTASKKADAIAAAVGTGSPLAQAAEGLAITTTDFVGRGGEGTADIPLAPGILDKAFAAPMGQPVTDSGADAEVVAVPVAERQRPGLDADDRAAAVTAATTAVAESLRQEFQAALDAALQQRYSVKRNEKALARLVAE